MIEMVCPYQKKTTIVRTLDKLTTTVLEEFSKCKSGLCPFYIPLNGERDRCARAEAERMKRHD